MARDHACVPWEYLNEMDELNDSEFGRLMRALLTYSMTGEPMALTGNERFYAKRVMSREDRYQESYKKQSAVNAANGANGGRPSKSGGGSRASGGNRNKPKKSEEKRTEADESEKTHTDTYTDTDTDTETNAASGGTPLPPAADPELARAMTAILDFIPQLSPPKLEKFAAYYQSLGADVCVLAVYEARDNSVNGRGAWAYIEAILERCQNSGIRSQADWEADKARRKSNRLKLGGQPSHTNAQGEYEYNPGDLSDSL